MLSVALFIIMLSVIMLNVTLFILSFFILKIASQFYSYAECRNAECGIFYYYAGYHIFIIMSSVSLVSVTFFTAILSYSMLGVFMLSTVMLNV